MQQIAAVAPNMVAWLFSRREMSQGPYPQLNVGSQRHWARAHKMCGERGSRCGSRTFRPATVAISEVPRVSERSCIYAILRTEPHLSSVPTADDACMTTTVHRSCSCRSRHCLVSRWICYRKTSIAKPAICTELTLRTADRADDAVVVAGTV